VGVLSGWWAGNEEPCGICENVMGIFFGEVHDRFDKSTFKFFLMDLIIIYLLAIELEKLAEMELRRTLGRLKGRWLLGHLPKDSLVLPIANCFELSNKIPAIKG
jgi:hypothetical protein